MVTKATKATKATKGNQRQLSNYLRWNSMEFDGIRGNSREFNKKDKDKRF